MANWLPLSLVFGVVLVTSYTSMGLLALWAATSRWHWLLRTIVVLAVLAPLLLIPAYEPWIVFFLQACTVALGVQVWRSRAARRRWREVSDGSRPPKRRFRFYLSTLLAITPLVALLTIIATRIVANLPEQNATAWTTIVLNGLCSGCTALLGAWMVAGDRKWIVRPAAFVLCLGLAAVMAAFDGLLVSAFPQRYWPPFPATVATMIRDGVMPWRLDVVLPWFVITPALTLGLWMMVALWHRGTIASHVCGDPHVSAPQRRHGRRIAARCVFAALFAALALPPALVVEKLLHPLPPLPDVTVPVPNGLDDIVAAAKELEKSSILSMAAEPSSTDELAAEVAKYAGAYQRLRQGLSRDVGPEFWTHEEDLADVYNASVNNLMRMRWAARALMREAELAQQQNRHNDAVRIALENVRFGQVISRDALMVDYLTGRAIEEIGDQSLYQSLPHLNAEQCREAIAALVEVERRREPIDEVLRRDRIWEEHVGGWFHRFCQLLSDSLPSKDSGNTSRFHAFKGLKDAVTRLLILELAVLEYRLERGELPDRLEQLTPEFLDELPIDPFDSEGRPLRYVRTDDGFLIYSIGEDGKDDGGRLPARKGRYVTNENGDGDLWLDACFAPEESADDAANQ